MFGKTVRKVLLVMIGVTIGLLLRDPVRYLTSPDDSLIREAGWLSHDQDRSWRIDLLFSLGADPNKPNEEHSGYTALHSAVLWGNVSVVRQLVAHGANPNLTTTYGFTALDIACGIGQAETVSALVELGAKTSREAIQCNQNG